MLDTNRDGRLTRSEWSGSAAVFDALDTNRDGVLTRAEAVGSDERQAGGEFRSADLNRDGFVSRDEWPWNAAAFNRLDANRDGRLSRSEFESAPAADAPEQTATYRAGYERFRGADSMNARTEIGLATDPPSAESCCRPAPSVLEFDQSGAVVGQWGGPGEGYEWPGSPGGRTATAA